MQENDLRSILSALGIQAGRASSKGWISFRCPLAPWTHRSGRDSHASAAAKVETGKLSSWGCQGCKASGTIRKLAIEYMTARDGKVDGKLLEKIELAETGSLLHVGEWGEAETVGTMLPHPVNEAMLAGIYPEAYQHPWGVEYLSNRRISEATAQKLGLLYDPDQGEHRVLFPVRAGDGNLYGFSGRAVQPDREPKIKDYLGLPKRHLILGEHRWRQGMPKIIVEGLFAFAHLHEIGVEEHADIGALLGSELTPEKRERIITWGDPVYMMVDNDPAGDACLFGRIDPQTKKHKIEEGSIAALDGYVPVMVPDWPLRENGSPKEDPDELFLGEVMTMLQAWPFVLEKKRFRR